VTKIKEAKPSRLALGQARSTAPVLVFVVMLQPFMMMGRHPIAVMTNPPVAIVPYMMAIVVADDHRSAGALVPRSGIGR
jgi:hypothetical protein